MRSLAPAALVVLAVSGCAALARWTSEPPIPLSERDLDEYDRASRPGSLTLRGQAFLLNRSGDVKLAAGRRVTLDPATDYARTWFRRYGVDTARFEDIPDEPRFNAARRVTMADGEGRFRFRDLPAGTYLVRTLVTWQDRRDSVQQGGVVAALAEVGPDRREELIMARRVTRDSAAALVVEILEDADLAGRHYRSLGRLTSWSCEVGSEEPARWNLRYRAAEEEADAVVGVTCRRRGVTFNCWRSIECEGEGLQWEG